MRPVTLIILLLAVVPLIELYVLLQVGGSVGALPTIFLVVLTAVLGMMMVRWQGITTFQRVQRSLAAGELPAVEMLEALVLLVSGLLLLTPGFVTDSIGFLLLLPPLRQGVIKGLLIRGLSSGLRPNSGNPDSADGPRTIEGQYKRFDD